MTKKFCVLYIFHGKTPQMTQYGAIHKLRCNSALDDPERNVLRILVRPDCDWRGRAGDDQMWDQKMLVHTKGEHFYKYFF